MSTKIEWCDETWNPIVGCTPISPGCNNCYARSMARRFKMPGWNGWPAFKPERLGIPSKWKKPRRVFVNSMGDLFHCNVETEWIDKVFQAMAASPQHTFMVLTKRPWAMRDYMRSRYHFPKTIPNRKPPKNVWLGVTAENQVQADNRIPELLETPAAIRFVSVEPMLGSVDFRVVNCRNCNSEEPRPIIPCPSCRGHRFIFPDWVICGAETGRGKRYMVQVWYDFLLSQCRAANVPFFGKKDSTGKALEPREWPEG